MGTWIPRAPSKGYLQGNASAHIPLNSALRCVAAVRAFTLAKERRVKGYSGPRACKSPPAGNKSGCGLNSEFPGANVQTQFQKSQDSQQSPRVYDLCLVQEAHSWNKDL